MLRLHPRSLLNGARVVTPKRPNTSFCWYDRYRCSRRLGVEARQARAVERARASGGWHNEPEWHATALTTRGVRTPAGRRQACGTGLAPLKAAKRVTNGRSIRRFPPPWRTSSATLVGRRSPICTRDNVECVSAGFARDRLCRGPDVTIEYRWAENRVDRLPQLVAELPKSVDEPGRTLPPRSASRALSFSSASPAGVFLGAPMPYYRLAS
jgi:hypothetical protein